MEKEEVKRRKAVAEKLIRPERTVIADLLTNDSD